MDGDLIVSAGAGRIVIPGAELEERFSRSSGPGGQGVNTTDSRVQLRFDLLRSPSLPESLRARALRRLQGRLVDGCIVITASTRRSQWQNREDARERLADMLGTALAPGPRTRRPTRPSRAATDRRIDAKKQRGMTKRLRRSSGGGED